MKTFGYIHDVCHSFVHTEINQYHNIKTNYVGAGQFKALQSAWNFNFNLDHIKGQNAIQCWGVYESNSI